MFLCLCRFCPPECQRHVHPRSRHPPKALPAAAARRMSFAYTFGFDAARNDALRAVGAVVPKGRMGKVSPVAQETGPDLHLWPRRFGCAGVAPRSLLSKMKLKRSRQMWRKPLESMSLKPKRPIQKQRGRAVTRRRHRGVYCFLRSFRFWRGGTKQVGGKESPQLRMHPPSCQTRSESDPRAAFPLTPGTM
jgi:hypothetical protein